MPRLVDPTSFRLLGLCHELTAQSMAMQRWTAQRRPVVGTVTDTGVTFAYVGGAQPGQLLAVPQPPRPASPESWVLPASPSMPAQWHQPTTSTGAALPVTVTGTGTTLKFQIEVETGLFRALP